MLTRPVNKICWQNLLTKPVDKTWHGLGKNDIFLSNMRHGPEKLEIMLTNMTWSWQTGFWQTWYWHSLNLILKKSILAVLDWFSILFSSCQSVKINQNVTILLSYWSEFKGFILSWQNDKKMRLLTWLLFSWKELIRSRNSLSKYGHKVKIRSNYYEVY